MVLSIYNGMEFLEECLSHWISLRDRLNIQIAIVDCLFDKFYGETLNSNDGTVELLQQYLAEGKIDFFDRLPPNLQENQARNVAIKYLISQNVTHVLTTAPDEIFDTNNILKIFNHLSQEQRNALYYIDYKNYIGNKKTYILGFCPKRIWKTKHQSYVFNGLIHDDDGVFYDLDKRKMVPDNLLPHQTIPNLQVKHYSWLDGESSRKKIEYQTARGWLCSYTINDDNQVLMNEAFYQLNPTKERPTLYHE